MNDKGIRLYDLARRLTIPSRELINLLRTKGIEVKSHMSSIDAATADMLLEHFGAKRVSKFKKSDKPKQEYKEVQSPPLQTKVKQAQVYTGRTVTPLNQKTNMSSDIFKKRRQRGVSRSEVQPGVNPNIDFFRFNSTEKEIIKTISQNFYVTSPGKNLKLGNSMYRYILIKPVDDYRELFNLEREIVVIFSPYANFEPRTFSAFSSITDNYAPGRIETFCNIIISLDDQFEKKLNILLKRERELRESQVVIPFTYSELLQEKEPYFFKNRFKEYFYERDLFDFEAPLRKDVYFFGRKNIVHELVDRHLSRENSGIFGLRKVGKTSILYSVERELEKRGEVCILLDCQKLYHKRWNKALLQIVKEITRKYNLRGINIDEQGYTEEKTVDSFENDIKIIYNKLQKKRILIIFDEIEHITFNISLEDHWKEGKDFLKFWHVLRSLFQQSNNILTYLIAGTNPQCVEKTSILKVDNPIYSQIPIKYIEPFSIQQTKEMVNTLGGYMGLSFEEDIYTYLTRHFGGHPFLIRQVCSLINKTVKDKKPIKINRLKYNRVKPEFDQQYGKRYAEMVLEVLNQYYQDEYAMLEMLATDDIKGFNEFAELSPEFTNHLRGYGILEKTNDGYDLKIDVLKDYLSEKHKYKKINLTDAEKLAEISERRNMIEPKLRKIVRNQLLVKYGHDEAKKLMLERFPKAKRRKYLPLTYNELFDPNKTEIYFDDLRELMKKDWEECFRNIFNVDVEKFDSRMKILNELRDDAHAKKVADFDMQSFRGAMTWLEEKVKDFS